MCKWLLRLAVAVFCLMFSMPVFAASRSMIQDGWYKIIPLHAQNKSLDVNGAGRDAGTNLQLWTYGDAPQQKFYVQHRGNGWYSFKAGHCDLYVDVQWGSAVRGGNVWLYPWNGTDSQLWGLYAAGDGGYYIETKLQSNLVLDCAGGQANDGNNVQLWTKENVNWHKWKFVPVSFSTASSSEKYAVATSGSNLLLRSGPGAGYGIIARMPNGSTVDVYSINNGWAELNYNGTRGYASAAYLRKVDDPIPVPTPDSEETKVLNRINQLYSTNGYRLNTRYTGSGQCRGFANKVYQTLFAVGYIGGYTNDNYGAASYPSSYSVGSIRNFAANDVNSVRNLFNKAKPGAFVQIGRRYKLNSSRSAAAPHSAIVVSVDSNGVTFYEANTDGKNTIKKNYYTWAQLADRNKGYTIYLPNTYRLK